MERVRQVSFSLMIDTNKRTIKESFTSLPEMFERCEELANEGLLDEESLGDDDDE